MTMLCDCLLIAFQLIFQGGSGERLPLEKGRPWRPLPRELSSTTPPSKSAQAWKSVWTNSSAFRVHISQKRILMTLDTSELLCCLHSSNSLSPVYEVSRTMWMYWRRILDVFLPRVCCRMNSHTVCVSVFLSEQMVECTRAAAGAWWERMPNATITIQWESPSWAISTVRSRSYFLYHELSW